MQFGLGINVTFFFKNVGNRCDWTCGTRRQFLSPYMDTAAGQHGTADNSYGLGWQQYTLCSGFLSTSKPPWGQTKQHRLVPCSTGYPACSRPVIGGKENCQAHFMKPVLHLS
jgi:hypothetical protein